jgi:hypothetical protein
MDPVTLVVTALAAGAAAGLTNTASQVVVDAYDGLKRLVVGLLSNSGVAEPAGRALVDNVSASPDSKSPMVEALSLAEVDEPTQQAARELLDLLEAAQRGKFTVDASQAKGIIVGDHATQHNTFQ